MIDYTKQWIYTWGTLFVMGAYVFALPQEIAKQMMFFPFITILSSLVGLVITLTFLAVTFNNDYRDFEYATKDLYIYLTEKIDENINFFIFSFIAGVFFLARYSGVGSIFLVINVFNFLGMSFALPRMRKFISIYRENPSEPS